MKYLRAIIIIIIIIIIITDEIFQPLMLVGKYLVMSPLFRAFAYHLHIAILYRMMLQTIGWADIGYNFLIGEDGRVYEGRGWKVTGAHTFSYNDSSIGISFIGIFETRAPSDVALRATHELIRLGVKEVRQPSELIIPVDNRIIELLLMVFNDYDYDDDDDDDDDNTNINNNYLFNSN